MRARVIAKPATIFAVLLLTFIANADAQQGAPGIIPRRAHIGNSPAVVFGNIQNHLGAKFSIVRADATTGKIVAKRSGVDVETWTQWAYCKVPAQDMLGNLQTDSVELSVTVAPAAGNSSDVSVAADFQATYALGTRATAASCVSNGVLENEILDSAGARVP